MKVTFVVKKFVIHEVAKLAWLMLVGVDMDDVSVTKTGVQPPSTY